MAQEKIEILFKPKGDKQLIAAIKQLDVVTKRLKGTTSIYEAELKKLLGTISTIGCKALLSFTSSAASTLPETEDW